MPDLILGASIEIVFLFINKSFLTFRLKGEDLMMCKSIIQPLILILALFLCTAAKQVVVVHMVFVEPGIISQTKVEKPAGQSIQTQGTLTIFK